MKALALSLIVLISLTTFASAYTMSEGVVELQEKVQSFDWSHATIQGILILVYGLLQKVIIQDAIIQELSKRPEYCGGGSSSPVIHSSIQESPQEIEGDLNGDGSVNQADVNIITSHFGQNNSEFDLNGDGFIGQADLDIVLANIDGSTPTQDEIDASLTS